MFDIRKIQEEVIYNAVKAKSDDITAGRIVNHVDEADPLWVKNTMRRLEESFDLSTLKRIRMNCQCGYGMDEKYALLKEIMESSNSLEEFGRDARANAAGMFCRDGDLYLQFPFCPCPMVAGVDKLETKTWCQCTTGYSKVLFEKAFGCTVDVELLKSIKAGDEVCLMKITPLGKVLF
ncbi:MAG TPA: DUF6144 family protein [Bacteroidales bacterium]|nr:DUF6144 family protein [Bacteroidales bacterium]